MTGRIEKTVFISYRRTNMPWALAIYQHLTSQGYDVFFDYLSIPSGDFENIIVENIKARAHFIVILTPSALERCHEPGDWLRREIETAIEEKRNIVPLMLESFDFGSPAIVKALTGKLNGLKKYNALRVPSEYFFEAMNRLREQFLSIPLDAILHPVSDETRQTTEEQQFAASDAQHVGQEQLSAVEWFEKGYKSSDPDEKIRCFTEFMSAVREFTPINSKLISDVSAKAFINRGFAFIVKGDFDAALADFDEAVHLRPDDIDAYQQRGLSRQLKGDFEGAIKDYEKVIGVSPEAGAIRSSLMGVLRKLGRDSEADEQEQLARPLMQKENEYSQANFESLCGNVNRALELLRIALEKKQASKQWTRRDPDFENIRTDPRFKELVGE